MSKDLISKKTRNELREYFVGIVARDIEREFEEAGIACNSDYDSGKSGVRRSLVEQYYNTLNFSNTNDVKKFLLLCENVLVKLDDSLKEQKTTYDCGEYKKKSIENLVKCLEKDGFLYERGRLRPKLNTVIKSIAVPLHEIDCNYITEHLERIDDSLDTDPSLAVGTAKELVESVSKNILDDCGVAYTSHDKVGDLVNKVRKALKLLPEDIDDSARGSKLIKTLLSNLGQIVQIIAELRNLYGTGHGKSSKSKGGLSQRHARLVVGAASALTVFLYETHKERGIKPLKDRSLQETV